MIYIVVTYNAISDNGVDKFHKAINDFLAEGFELYGNPFSPSITMPSTSSLSEPTALVCQAIIKRIDSANQKVN